MFFTLLFLSPKPILAADIDTTLTENNATIYTTLLQRIEKGPKNDETALQKALLGKLIHMTKHPDRRVSIPGVPADEESYRSLIIQYGNWSLSRDQLETSTAGLAEKIRLIEEQIKKLPAEAPKTLTLQLQYAFYVKSLRAYRRKLAMYGNLIDQAPPLFVEGVSNVRFDINATMANLDRIEEKLQKIENEIQGYDIERERLNLLGKTEMVRRLNYGIQVLQAKRYSLLTDKLAEMFILYSDALKHRDSTDTFALQNRMTEIMESFFPVKVRNDLGDLFNTMDTAILGRAETIKGATMEEIRRTVSLFWRKMNEPLFSLNETPISALKMIGALLIFILGILIGGFYKTYLRKIFRNHQSITLSTQTLLANLGYYVIVVIAFFSALNVIGVNLSSIALVAGALSVGIGFGLQNVVSNFVSGIILMFERSIKIGDYIEFDENLRGHVSDIRMRSTTITTNANIDVIVPNQDLIQNRVINWTMNDRIRRFDIPFGVAYGSDVDRVIEVVLEAVKQSGFTDILTTPTRRTRVIMTQMNESSVDFELHVWIRGRETLYPKRTRSRFLILIYKTLYANGIEIPFPQRDIHIRSIDGEIPLALHGKEKIGRNPGGDKDE
jgi:small-conductance mechanosensitive channel